MKDTELYTKLLGLSAAWKVEDVKMDIEEQEIVVEIAYSSSRAPCPVCQEPCPIYDHREPRRWRHLDTCQMQTYLICSVPRIACKSHKVKTISFPWSEESSRFTLLFERFAIDLLKATWNQSKVSEILRISFDSLNYLMHKAVQRGLSNRDKKASIPYVGIDEKSFQQGHHYVSVLVDIKEGSVIEVEEHRDEAAAITLITKSLSVEQRKAVRAVSLDMWAAFMNAAQASLPNAELVHDRFHIIKYLSDAIDKTRRGENKELRKKGDETLTSGRYAFLKNKENMTNKQRELFQIADSRNLRSAQAWRMRENFKDLFNAKTTDEAIAFFTKWENHVQSSEIKAMKKVAKTFKDHIGGIINYINHRITNAIVERLNGKIQQIKTIARGYRRVENFRIAILFFLGNLELHPQEFQ